MGSVQYIIKLDMKRDLYILKSDLWLGLNNVMTTTDKQEAQRFDTMALAQMELERLWHEHLYPGADIEKVAVRRSACWNISLDTTCPQCGEDIDLIEHEYRHDGTFDIGERGTDRTRGIRVTCGHCLCEFTVDLMY